MGQDRVDDRRLLADEQMSRAMERNDWHVRFGPIADIIREHPIKVPSLPRI
jgi:hypothetical protein